MIADSFLRLPLALVRAGLTDVEIDRAIRLAQSTVNQAVATGTSNQTVAPPLPPRPPPPTPVRSRSWSEYALLAVVVGGVGYAVVQFVRVSPL